MGFDPDALMKEMAGSKPNVLFYPSCGNNISGLFDMPYDIFILADYYPNNTDERKAFFKKLKKSEPKIRLYKSTVRTRVFRVGSKWGFLFFQDNNEVFRRITDAGFKISCFVGVNDGCREGGNYECVNDIIWLKKVLKQFQNNGLYITDHSPVVYDPPKSLEYMGKNRYTGIYGHPISHFKLEKWELRLGHRSYRGVPFSPFYSSYLAIYVVTTRKGI